MTKELTRPEITDSSYLECHVPLGKKIVCSFVVKEKKVKESMYIQNTVVRSQAGRLQQI